MCIIFGCASKAELFRRSSVNLFAVFVPRINPSTIAGDKGITGHAGNVTYRRDTHRFVVPAITIEQVYPTAIPGNEERRTVPHNLADRRNAQRLILPAGFVVKAHPIATHLNTRDSTSARKHH